MMRSCLILSTLVLISSAFSGASFRGVTSTAGRAGAVSSASSMLQPRSAHTATLLLDGKVLIAGGMRRNQDFYKSAELYDPSTGKFATTGEMKIGPVGHVAVLLRSGKVLVAGGWVGHVCTDSAELYDPANGKFTSLTAKMTTPRGDARATLLGNGDILITGGGEANSPDGIASSELFRTPGHELSCTTSYAFCAGFAHGHLDARWARAHSRRQR